MKRAKFSKVLAFLLAAVMIFSALPLMAFASDETEPYVVSYGSPAIPMDEMTIVNLADISVEMEKGTVVSGADITWSADAQTGIEFDAADLDRSDFTGFGKSQHYAGKILFGVKIDFVGVSFTILAASNPAYVAKAEELYGLTAGQCASLTVGQSLANFIPVTIGNMIGGMVCVGALCFAIYRKEWKTN